MTNKQHCITIIIATLNAASTIERCLNSIINQTYTDFELIIIDGGSKDGTQALIQKYTNYISYYASVPDSGIYNAWNKALKCTTGEWICFLGADDYFWDKDVLNTIYPHLKNAAFSNIRIVYAKVARIDKSGRVIKVWGKPWNKIKWQLPHGMPVGMPHTGLMHHKSLFSEHSFFDDTLKLAGDYEFLLRELKNKNRKPFFVHDLITVAQQVGGAADSNALSFHREVAEARKKNKLPRFSWLWWIIHIRAILRHYLHKSKIKE